MVFSSLTFIFFILPLFLLLDFQCRGNTNARNIVLIAVSLLFYTWGSSKHLIILILFGILNFIFGKFLQNTILAQKHKNISLTLLILFCTINILGLAYYLNWYGHVRRGVSPLRQLNQGTHSGIVS